MNALSGSFEGNDAVAIAMKDQGRNGDLGQVIAEVRRRCATW